MQVTTVSKFCVLLIVTCFAVSRVASADDKQSKPEEQLWKAARQGDIDSVRSLIEGGLDVDVGTPYAATALSFAADRGHIEVVEFLLEKGADANVKDSFYNATPMTWAISRDHPKIVKALVVAGAKDVDRALPKAITDKDFELIKAIAASKALSFQALYSSLERAKGQELEEAIESLQTALDKRFPSVSIDEGQLESLAGVYQEKDAEKLLRIQSKDGTLSIANTSSSGKRLYAKSELEFSDGVQTYVFEVSEDVISTLTLDSSEDKVVYRRLNEEEANKLPTEPKSPNSGPNAETETFGEFAASSMQSKAADLSISSPNWGQFRGPNARGVADGQDPPESWNVEKEINLAWKRELPGLGHSCPVVWDGRVYLTTAISEKDTSIKTGLYGDVASVEDDSVHEFVVYCLDAKSGEVLWEKLACKKVPSVKRHLKSTHANSTVATNGQYVVAWFGSEGVYCYDTEGNLIWERQLGLLDSGWFYDREYQWQFAASPIISGDKLILQCDIQDQSFIAAYELSTGEEIWKTDRDEIPSWSTPTVVETPAGLQVVTNATKAARGYELATGKELWRIEGNSEIAVPTPFTARGLLFVCSGYRPIQPIYAIRPDALGDLSLEKGQKESEYVAWSVSRGGPYMPTPLVYGDYLYVCSNSGILTCYQATSGELVYKKRLQLETSRSFVGAPIAADGKLYFTNEEGETLVVKAGPKFEEVGHSFIGEPCLTTAAISQGTFYLRGQKHLFALRTAETSTNGAKRATEESSQQR